MNPLAAQILAILFAAGRSVSIAELSRGLMQPEAEVKKALAALARTLEAGDFGVALEEVAGGWRLIVHPKHHAAVHRALRPRPPRLSRAALEVLAIIAYRQPITRAEIEAIRGKNSDAVLEGLEARGLVSVVGEKATIGRPKLYGTTQRFLEVFGLQSLEELPGLEGPELPLLRD